MVLIVAPSLAKMGSWLLSDLLVGLSFDQVTDNRELSCFDFAVRSATGCEKISVAIWLVCSASHRAPVNRTSGSAKSQT
ncbi:hypothetical protein [Bradyrhizobium sp. USDA 377]